MQCSSCGKSGFVSVGDKRFCSNCGAALSQTEPIRAMSDLRPSSQPRPVNIDISSAPTRQSIPPTNAPKPAGQFHGRQVGSGVIDLRAASLSAPPAAVPAPVPTPAPTQPAPIPEASIMEQAMNISDVTPIAPVPGAIVIPATTPAASPQPAPNPATQPTVSAIPPFKTDRVAERLQKAATFTKHPMVFKFPAKAVTPVVPAHSQSMPNLVATHIDAMGQKAAVLQPRTEALQTALSAAKPGKFNMATAAAGIAVIAIMGSYIWTQNYPKMAFHSAASKAGFSATLPSYVPSSYRQSDPTSYRAGEITISFSSPGINKPLNIVQRRTDWDSNSLRENFVAKQSDNYTAVQGQGLTIYLFDKNQASWVNHGVWYTISGAEKLNRDQLLKIAYGL